MAVKLKLTRMGSKKHPFYRIVATNIENARDSRPLEFLGYYNPMVNPVEVKLDAEKIQQWNENHLHFEAVGTPVEMKQAVNPTVREQCEALGRAVAERLIADR